MIPANRRPPVRLHPSPLPKSTPAARPVRKTRGLPETAQLPKSGSRPAEGPAAPSESEERSTVATRPTRAEARDGGPMQAADTSASPQAAAPQPPRAKLPPPPTLAPLPESDEE